MAYFEYCTVQDLRDEDILPAECSDDRALMLIRRASSKINMYTSQWFGPVSNVQYVDGQNSSMVWLPGFVPVIKLSAIEILPGRSARVRESVLPDRRVFNVDVSGVQLSRGNRFIEMIADMTGVLALIPQEQYDEVWFPEGRQNVKLTGVFGWMESPKDLQATVAADAAKGAGDVQVVSTAGWEAGDVAIFPDGTQQIVTGVAEAPIRLLFQGDPYKLRVAVTAGQIIQTYGRTPDLIRYCTMKLTKLMVPKIGNEDEQADEIQKAIVSEKTDNYSYKLDPSLLRERFEAGAMSTGDSEVDSILTQMIDEIPAYIGFA